MKRPNTPLRIGPDARGFSVLVGNGRIISAGFDVDAGFDAGARPAPADDPIASLDCSDGLIEAGWVNAHTHLYSGLAGLGMPAPSPKPNSFLEILSRVWWRLDRALDEDSLRASARHYVAQSLLAGTTCLVDHHESPNFIEGSLDILAEACTELGTRALLGYGISERNGGPQEAYRGLLECGRLARENRSALICPSVAVHASFTVSDESLRAAAKLSDELNLPVHVHVAEDAADLQDASERGYESPMARFHALGLLPPEASREMTFVAAHGVHMGAEQIRQWERPALFWVHNPRSNEGNGVGFASGLSASSRVALGTDGYPAAMEEEAAAGVQYALSYHASLDTSPAPSDGDAAALADTSSTERPAARGGASPSHRRSVGEAMVGRLFRASAPALNPGALADLRVVDGQGVRHVVVGGEVVVLDGVLTRAELSKIEDESQVQAQRLWKRMEKL